MTEAQASTAEQAKRFLPQIGKTGLNQSEGRVSEESDQDLRGAGGVKIYDNMRKSDPSVAVGLRAINWILCRVPWRVVAKGESAQDENARAFVESCMTDMTYPWSKLVRDALTCLPFGWAYCEVVYKVRQGRVPADQNAATSHYDDGQIGIRKIVLLSQATLDRWEIDDEGTILGMYQNQDVKGGGTKSVFVPIEKSLLFRLDDERNNPEGLSLLRPVYNAWYAKGQIQEIEAIGIERDLTGVLIINMPSQATDADFEQAKILLEQFKADDMTGFVAPQFGPGDHERWRFEIINSPGNKSIDVGKVIDRYSFDIARMFLAQFLMLGGTDTGSFALSSDQKGVFELALETILDMIADVGNRYLVPKLMLLNGYETLEAYPEIKHGLIAKADILKFAQAMASLEQQKLVNYRREDEDFVREQLALPDLPPDFEWKPIEERNIENIVEMQKEVGQVADSQGRIQTPTGRPTPTHPENGGQKAVPRTVARPKNPNRPPSRER